MKNTQKKWLQRAEIDYFSPFMSLWASFNAWYQEHYPSSTGDRGAINRIKREGIKHNIFLKNADARLTGVDRESVEFRSNLEQLHYALEDSELNYDKVEQTEKMSFTNALIKYKSRNKRTAYQNLIAERDDAQAIQLGSIQITHETDIVAAGLLEIIYQTRCQFFHGRFEPEGVNREVVKYAYFVLLALMPR